VARYLRSATAREVVAVDAQGSVFAEYFRTRRLGKPGRTWSRPRRRGAVPVRGVDLLDDVLTVRDQDAFACARDLARKDAILAGGSSAPRCGACAR